MTRNEKEGIYYTQLLEFPGNLILLFKIPILDSFISIKVIDIQKKPQKLGTVGFGYATLVPFTLRPFGEDLKFDSPSASGVGGLTCYLPTWHLCLPPNQFPMPSLPPPVFFPGECISPVAYFVKLFSTLS